MRVIVEILGRVVGFEASLLHVKMVSSEDRQEEVEHLGHDPHSTVCSQVERRSDMEDMFGKQKFGFAHVTDVPHGSED
jgi:hypothetical protein